MLSLSSWAFSCSARRMPGTSRAVKKTFPSTAYSTSPGASTVPSLSHFRASDRSTSPASDYTDAALQMLPGTSCCLCSISRESVH